MTGSVPSGGKSAGTKKTEEKIDAFNKFFNVPKFTTDRKGNTTKNYKHGGAVMAGRKGKFKGTF